MKSRAILFTAKIAFIAIATALCYINIAISIVFVTVVILTVIYDRASLVAELSFGPLKAKLEREVSEAETLVAKLRDFSAIQARAAIAASASTGRLASGDDWVFQSAKRLESALLKLGVDDALILEARSDLVRLTLYDMAHAILGGNYVPSHLAAPAREEWVSLRGAKPYPQPAAVRSWLERYGQTNEPRSIRLADMQWIIEHHDVRDSEQYMRAHTPVEWQP